MSRFDRLSGLVGSAIAVTTHMFTSCSPSRTGTSHGATSPGPTIASGLILQANEGERRIRRPPPSSVATLAAPLIIKVDRRQGGSPDFFMGFEDIPVGRAIAAHRHPNMDEILFVHRGTGRASVGAKEGSVSAGATIYIPRDTRVTLRNTGTEPLTILFIFPNPDIGKYFRDFSVPEGERAAPFTAEEFTLLRARYRSHVIFE